MLFRSQMMLDFYAGCMQGRTLYVIPYCMGPLGSPFARYGVELTDSTYVAANMYLMTRMGKPALEHIEKTGSFIKGLHSVGELDPEAKFYLMSRGLDRVQAERLVVLGFLSDVLSRLPLGGVVEKVVRVIEEKLAQHA